MMRKPHSGSIIMPVFNRAGLLDRALRNLLRQTYRNSEIIITDDASTDQAPSVIRSYENEHSFFRSIRLEKNSGGAAART